jgi:DNA topoisomerase I
VPSLDELPAELVWADDSEPGIRRRRAGKGFVYIGPDGRRITDQEVLARIRVLAVPPAWGDVWICLDECGHLQATGRDARGRKQYRYHASFRAHREVVKFARLDDFGQSLPRIRRQVAADLVLSGMPRAKVIATVVRLLEATLVRVGNEEYARANGSYGLTTLRNRHAQFTSDGLRLVFKGKHGLGTSVRVQDQRLRRVVKQCQDLPGQFLFQYLDEDGVAVPLSSTDVNDYLRAVADMDVTAKDFRTWMATLLAVTALAQLEPPRSERERQRKLKHVLEDVSGQLGNTPAVCRASYVHPTVVEWFGDGSLPGRWESAAARGDRLLLPEERKLLRVLRGASRRRAPMAKAA